MRRLTLLFCLLLLSHASYSQDSNYMLFQLGGQFGFANPGFKGAFNGYTAHFIFGKHFNDRGSIGLGFGNETFRGKYQINHSSSSDQRSYEYDTYMLPVFLDGRYPLAYVGTNGRVGMLANAGYAIRISPIYDKGFLFRGGFFYQYETAGRTDYILSASYGYQQLHKNIHQRVFNHQHLSVSLGILLK